MFYLLVLFLSLLEKAERCTSKFITQVEKMIPMQALGTQAFIQRPELTWCYDGLVTLMHSKIMWEGRLDLRIIWIRLACGNICGAVLTALIDAGRPGVREVPFPGSGPWAI